jgi:serine/threonine protein phosphatase PrpC
MSVKHGYERNEYLAYAFYNIAASSNEDRFATFASHEREGMPSMASFGVFDGHMGSTAAEACSTQLHGMVALNSRQLSNVIVSKSAQAVTPPSPPDGSYASSASPDLATHLAYLTPDDLRDAVVCEAINRASTELDFEVRRYSNAGTTVSSLFLLWDTDDRDRVAQLHNGPAGHVNAPVRVYCANMGDSRCVMLRCYDTKEALSLPSNFEPTAKRSGGDVETLGSKFNGMEIASPGAAANRFVAVHLMSEDHKLQLARERARVTAGSRWVDLPHTPPL